MYKSTIFETSNFLNMMEFHALCTTRLDMLPLGREYL